MAGLDRGAVDYLVKPFSLAELAARIRAQLRSASLGAARAWRRGRRARPAEPQGPPRRAKPIALSSTEFELLAHLMRNHDRVVGREEILSAVWGYQHDPATNIVDVYIGYLRRKLRLPDSPAPIQTVRSVGYRFGRAGS